MPSKDRLREAAEKRIKELSRLRQRSLRQRIADYGPQEQYTEELEHEMKRHGSLSGRKSGRKSRSLRGLGATPKQHADKAYNAANKAILAFSAVVRDEEMSCRAKLAVYTGGVAARGEYQAHVEESRGVKISAPDRRGSLEASENEAHDAVAACFRKGGLNGMRRRRTSRR